MPKLRSDKSNGSVRVQISSRSRELTDVDAQPAQYARAGCANQLFVELFAKVHHARAIIISKD